MSCLMFGKNGLKIVPINKVYLTLMQKLFFKNELNFRNCLEKKKLEIKLHNF